MAIVAKLNDPFARCKGGFRLAGKKISRQVFAAGVNALRTIETRAEVRYGLGK
jgi:hypothetical protein